MPGQDLGLPLELLVEEVISHLDTWRDRKTLKALAQTCRAFVVPSQRILFEELSCGEGTYYRSGWNEAYSINELIDFSCHFADYFRHVLLSLSDLPSAEDPRSEVHYLLGRLRHVETLELSSSLIPESIDESSLDYLNYRGSLGGIKDPILYLLQDSKHITLTNVNLHLSNLALSSVRVLRLRNGHIIPDKDSGSTQLTHLKKIEMSWSGDLATRSLETVLRVAKNLCSCYITISDMEADFETFISFTNTVAANPSTFRHLDVLEVRFRIQENSLDSLLTLALELNRCFAHVTALTTLILHLQGDASFDNGMETAFHQLDTTLAQQMHPTIKKFRLEYSVLSLSSVSPELGALEEARLKQNVVACFPTLRKQDGFEFYLALTIFRREFDTSGGPTTEVLVRPMRSHYS